MPRKYRRPRLPPARRRKADRRTPHPRRSTPWPTAARVKRRESNAPPALESWHLRISGRRTSPNETVSEGAGGGRVERAKRALRSKGEGDRRPASYARSGFSGDSNPDISAVPPARPGRGSGERGRSGVRSGGSVGAGGGGGSLSPEPNTSSSLFPSNSSMNSSRS